MSNKIYKSLTQEVSDIELEYSSSRTITFISWERLKPHIQLEIGKALPNNIKGLEITKDGLNVILD